MSFIKKLLGMLSFRTTSELDENEGTKLTEGRTAELRKKLGIPKEIVSPVFRERQKDNESDDGNLKEPIEVGLNIQLIKALLKKVPSSTIERLIGEGADANVKDESGTPALLLAVRSNNLDAVRALLVNGAFPDAEETEGSTALMFASSEGYEPIVKILLASGADPNKLGTIGLNALCWAASGGKSFIIQDLLDSGADVNKKNKGGLTALMIAAQKGWIDVLSLLLKNGARINEKEEGKLTALHQACMKGHTEAVRLLIDNGADVNACDHNGGTCLMEISFKGNVDIAKMLISAGAEINAKSNGFDRNTGRTAMYWACSEGHASIVKLLLEGGADMEIKYNSVTETNYTALMVASENGHQDIVELLETNKAQMGKEGEMAKGRVTQERAVSPDETTAALHARYDAGESEEIEEVKQLLRERPDFVKITIQKNGGNLEGRFSLSSRGQQHIVQYAKELASSQMNSAGDSDKDTANEIWAKTNTSYLIGKEQVELLDTGLITNAISETLNTLKERHSFAPLIFSVHGYDHDPRSLAAIPEVRAWCKKLYRDAPSVFSIVDAQTFYWLLPCIVDVEVVNAGTSTTQIRWPNLELLLKEIYKSTEKTFNNLEGLTQREGDNLWDGFVNRLTSALQKHGLK